MTEYAYSIHLIDDMMDTMGCMFQYAEVDLKWDMEEFYNMFQISSVASGIEFGDPKYIAGMSGVELARSIVYEKTRVYPEVPNSPVYDCTPWYWVGFVLCYYQWLRNVRFQTLSQLGLTAEKVHSLYILHDADLSKFAETADKITGLGQNKNRLLAYYRKRKHLTQKQLAEASGIPLRMIQLYEQGQNDLEKANARYAIQLSSALDCSVQELLG